MKQTIELINSLQSSGNIGLYAIGGWIGGEMDEISEAVPRPILTKSEWRERQRKLTFAEKIAVLEKMRQRDALIAKAGLRRK